MKKSEKGGNKRGMRKGGKMAFVKIVVLSVGYITFSIKKTICITISRSVLYCEDAKLNP